MDAMRPWPPSPHIPGSTTNDMKAAQIAASIALPPSSKTRAPASAAAWWPAATAPVSPTTSVRLTRGALDRIVAALQ
jgi:hypothetical protein